jgi:hypothetical protein
MSYAAIGTLVLIRNACPLPVSMEGSFGTPTRTPAGQAMNLSLMGGFGPFDKNTRAI